MEETLGKRIVSNRKRLGMTQDALAELLGVTAQAVSKWENDQSCPDIGTLPKLAEIFGISTDELLGREKTQVHTAELMAEDTAKQEPGGLHYQNGSWEFQWDGGKKSTLGLAVWVMLAGVLLLLTHAQSRGAFWEVLWSSGLLVFGLFGLFPRFSVFRLGCALLGGYFLLNTFLPVSLEKELLLPILLLLFGLSLLIDTFRKPKSGAVHITRHGKKSGHDEQNFFQQEGEFFSCSNTFCGAERLIQLPRLSGGEAEVSFGELVVDLSGCQEIADGCKLSLEAAFGQLTLLVPRNCRIVISDDTAFASVEVKGSPAPDAGVTLYLDCDASFGGILVRYI